MFDTTVDDLEVLARISALSDEQQHLLRCSRGVDGLDAEARARLNRIETLVDRYWDLLRQRRACRQAGRPLETAELRSSLVVANYRQ